jgi:hypothetical protein
MDNNGKHVIASAISPMLAPLVFSITGLEHFPVYLIALFFS